MDKNITVTVLFSQHGTWGGVGFKGELFYQKKEKYNILEILEKEITVESIEKEEEIKEEYIPAIKITDGPEEYINLIVFPGDKLPGLFAKGYNFPLSGKCFLGEIKIGNNAANLKQYSCPEVIYSMSISYLHIENDDLTADQKVLILEAVRFDKPLSKRFPAGASITELFTREELEGEKRGKVFYV